MQRGHDAAARMSAVDVGMLADGFSPARDARRRANTRFGYSPTRRRVEAGSSYMPVTARMAAARAGRGSLQEMRADAAA